MEIYINTQNLIDDIGSKYLMESGDSDPIPPKGTIVQSLNEAFARLTSECSRWIEPSLQTEAEDSLISGEQYYFPFDLTSRKAANKAQPLADMIHSYMVNSALAKIFSSMSQAELSAKHDSQTVSDMAVITKLLLTKLPPR